MLWESIMLLVMLNLSEGKTNCSESCLLCLGVVCLKCAKGYYGLRDDCTGVCNAHCKGGQCSFAEMCSLGCKDGWYGYGCDRRCIDDSCEKGRCNHHTGYCYKSSKSCSVGECGDQCQQYCEDQDYSSEEHKVGMSTELIMCIAFGTIASVISCFCCLIKYWGKMERIENTNVEVGPSSERLLVGQQRELQISPRISVPVSRSSDSLDSENDIVGRSHTCPNNTPIDVPYPQGTNATTSSYFTYSDAGDYSNSDEMPAVPVNHLLHMSSPSTEVAPSVSNRHGPPPSYRECTALPPSYDSLFKTGSSVP